MKAIILAAGQGSRLYPLTADSPKCLVHLRGKPLLNYQLDVFRSCGITDIVIVTGYKADALGPYGLRSYHNDKYSVTNMVYSLFCAEPELNDDIIVAYSDIVFERNVLETLLADRSEFGVIIDKSWQDLWSLRMSEPLADAETLKVDPNDYIVEIGKKPYSYTDIQGQYIGLFKVMRGVWGDIVRFYHNLDSKGIYDGQNYLNMFMTSLIDAIAKDLMPVKAVYIKHGWLEVDTLEDMKRYEQINSSSNQIFNFY